MESKLKTFVIISLLLAGGAGGYSPGGFPGGFQFTFG